MTTPAPEVLFLPPDWLGRKTPDGLVFERFRDGASLRIQGALEPVVRDGTFAESPLVRTLASVEPLLAELVRDVARHGPPAPPTRDRLLRSTGYDTLFLELTSRCNERCVHCYADSSPERTEVLEPELVDSVIEDAARLGYRRIQLTGGDPLISPTLLRAARAVRSTSVPILEIYTYGLALRDELLDALASLEPSFAFSYYSSEPSIHDAITRTPGSCERTLRAIERALARGLPVRASIVVGAANATTVPATVDTLVDHGVPRDGIAVIGEHAVGRGRHHPSSDAPEPPGEAGPKAHAATGDDFAGKLAVASDGRVHPCIFARDAVLGNVRETRLHDIVTAPIPLAIDVPRWLAANAALAPSLSCADCRLVRGALGATRLPLVPIGSPRYAVRGD